MEKVYILYIKQKLCTIKIVVKISDILVNSNTVKQILFNVIYKQTSILYHTYVYTVQIMQS